jgi:hypothetical protein
MYIEFNLVASSGRASYEIDYALQEWSNKYNIPYNVKNVKEFKRVTFNLDEYYLLFAMSWNPDQKHPALSKWRIVSDLNNKIEFDSVL